ncbi:hypothetical protein THAOC_25245 [Thalassiosira oceanica]|uniref:Uncharacterized protein n=1 Tax=Thalassiosira oceanica TaxID=159749 RepID=K0S8E8_THAOC|nr:hypothetical protein THAOC_25245 [Thalassiosira oceanica]|eukprot:EJK55062.1 hypothetical protein THAOC_25245 [Thalassiosira oceanica]
MAWAEEDADVDGLVVWAEDVDGLVAWQRKDAMTKDVEGLVVDDMRREGRGRVGASTRAASGARRAPTAADEAPDPIYDANDDPTMTAVRWTNDVPSDDTDDATGPPALPMGTSTMAKGRGRRSRVVVDVGSISASRRRREADESSNTTPARFCRRTTFRPTMTRTDDSGPLNSITDTSRGSQTGIRRATGGVIEWIEPTTCVESTRFDGSKRRAAKIGIDRCAEGSWRVGGA